MEKSTMHQDFDLEALVREKDFADLSLEERAEVLSEVSEREYRQMRELVVWSSELLRETRPNLTPRSDIQHRLQQRLRAKKKESPVLRVLRHPVPAWQVAAAMIVFVVSIQFFDVSGLFDGEHSRQFAPFADSTTMDSALKVGHHPDEDSVYATFEDSL